MSTILQPLRNIMSEKLEFHENLMGVVIHLKDGSSHECLDFSDTDGLKSEVSYITIDMCSFNMAVGFVLDAITFACYPNLMSNGKKYEATLANGTKRTYEINVVLDKGKNVLYSFDVKPRDGNNPLECLQLAEGIVTKVIASLE